MDKTKDSPRARNLMYTQQIAHLPEGGIEGAIERISKLEPLEYAYIIHDKDIQEDGVTPAEPHIHVAMRFRNARSIHNVSDQLEDNVQSLQMWKKGYGNMYRYLIHRTSTSSNKFQYSPKDVVASFDYSGWLVDSGSGRNRKREGSDEIERDIDRLGTGEIKLEDFIRSHSASVYARYKTRIMLALEYRALCGSYSWADERRQSGRTTKTIWIHGDTGTGKTSAAKAIAKKTGKDYFLAGSSRDMFQDYSGEHVLLFDEFRNSDWFRYSDLLRVTDPHPDTEGIMAPSRYFDKRLLPDLIIITSSLSPEDYHWSCFLRKEEQAGFRSSDSISQLYRRLGLILRFDEQSISRISSSGKVIDEIDNPFSAKARIETDEGLRETAEDRALDYMIQAIGEGYFT